MKMLIHWEAKRRKKETEGFVIIITRRGIRYERHLVCEMGEGGFAYRMPFEQGAVSVFCHEDADPHHDKNIQDGEIGGLLSIVIAGPLNFFNGGSV